VHFDRGRCERIVGWEYERTPVLAVIIWRLLRAGDDVVPSVLVSYVSRIQVFLVSLL
jgi:hypothetical protein